MRVNDWRTLNKNWATGTLKSISCLSAGSGVLLFPYHVRRRDERGEEVDGNVSAEHHGSRQLRQPETHDNKRKHRLPVTRQQQHFGTSSVGSKSLAGHFKVQCGEGSDIWWHKLQPTKYLPPQTKQRNEARGGRPAASAVVKHNSYSGLMMKLWKVKL